MRDSIRVAASQFQVDVGEWAAFFERQVRGRQDLVSGYLQYIRIMAAKGVPPIFEGQHLRMLLGLSSLEFLKLTDETEAFYREFRVPKRRGGERTLLVPSARLLFCQRWIDWYILRRAPVHQAAHGYVPNRSNLTNAKVHVGAEQVLKLDIRDFFGSIGFLKTISVFKSIGYPPNVSFLLAKLCTFGGFLPQGAASSPQISNIIMFEVDTAIEQYASSAGLRYSRYVDDLTLSGARVSSTHLAHVEEVLIGAGLYLNREKVFFQKGNKKIITGVSIGSGQCKLPRQMRRKYKNAAFWALKHPEASHDFDLDPIRRERLLGRLNYWRMVEPENEKVARLLNLAKGKGR